MIRDRDGPQVCRHPATPLAPAGSSFAPRAGQAEGGTPARSRSGCSGGDRLSPSDGLPVEGSPRMLRLGFDVPPADAAVDSGPGVQEDLSGALAALPQAARDPVEVDFARRGAREGDRKSVV